MSWTTRDMRQGFYGYPFDDFTYGPEYHGSGFGLSWVERDYCEYPKGIFWIKFEPTYYPKWHVLKGYKEQIKKMWRLK